jgi:pilus assembly protein Flp/PilA
MCSRLVMFQVKVTSARGDRGATSVEYALMAVLIAIVIVVAVKALGGSLNNIFNRGATSV